MEPLLLKNVICFTALPATFAWKTRVMGEEKGGERRGLRNASVMAGDWEDMEGAALGRCLDIT